MVCVCTHVSVMYVGIYAHKCLLTHGQVSAPVRRPKVNTGCAQFFSTPLSEAGSLTELGALQFGWGGWPVTSRQLPSPPQPKDCRGIV